MLLGSNAGVSSADFVCPDTRAGEVARHYGEPCNSGDTGKLEALCAERYAAAPLEERAPHKQVAADGTCQLRYPAGDDAAKFMAHRKAADDIQFIGGHDKQSGPQRLAQLLRNKA